MSSKNTRYQSQISNAAFKQLARNNVKKSIKDYMIYFITLSFGVALLYSFNSLDTIMSNLMGNGLLDAYIYMSRGILVIFSIIICLIFGYLITYSNNFLMKKRKREFGIYSTLGMDKRDINKLMFKETIIIGILSLVVGLIFGIFISQGLSIIALKMINSTALTLKFAISTSAIIKTIILFIFVLLLVDRFNKKNINKYKLIDLINADKKNEIFAEDNGRKNLQTFVISIVLMIGAYAILKKPKFIIISVLLLAIATYLFFISISDFVMKKIKRNKKVYYNNLNMFVISQMSSRIKTLSSTVTVICLVIFSALIVIPFGIGLADYFKEDIGTITPFDATISRHNIKNDESMWATAEYSDNNKLVKEKYISIEEELENNNVPFEDFINYSNEVEVYVLEDITTGMILNNIDKDSNYITSIIGISDYNTVREAQGLEAVTIKSDEFIVNENGSKDKKASEESINKDLSLNINGNQLKLGNLYFDTYCYNINSNFNNIFIVVADEVLDNLYPITTYLNVNYIESNNEYDNEFTNLIIDYKYDSDYSFNFDSKIVINGEKTALNITFSFIGIYLGIILLVSAGAILALQQISESIVNKTRFSALRKLGVKESDMKKAIFMQVFIFFMMPLALAIMHSIFISSVLYGIVLELSSVGLIKNILITLIIISIIYGSYFFISYYESLNVIEDKK